MENILLHVIPLTHSSRKELPSIFFLIAHCCVYYEFCKDYIVFVSWHWFLELAGVPINKIQFGFFNKCILNKGKIGQSNEIFNKVQKEDFQINILSALQVLYNYSKKRLMSKGGINQIDIYFFNKYHRWYWYLNKSFMTQTVAYCVFWMVGMCKSCLPKENV